MGIIERLRAKPNRQTTEVPTGNGQNINVPSICHSMEDDALRCEAARILSEVRCYLEAASDGSMSRNNSENLAGELLEMIDR